MSLTDTGSDLNTSSFEIAAYGSVPSLALPSKVRRRAAQCDSFCHEGSADLNQRSPILNTINEKVVGE